MAEIVLRGDPLGATRNRGGAPAPKINEQGREQYNANPTNQHVTFYSYEPPHSLICLLGEEAPTLTGGFGGWEEVERPRRVSITHWKGGTPIKQSVAVVMDGFALNRSVESDCKTLEKLGRPSQFAGDQPPILKISGAALLHEELDWVVESIDWGDSVRAARGHRLRQKATVVLLQYVRDVHIEVISAAQRAREDAIKENKFDTKGKTRTITVKKGDDLQEVAKRYLGRSERWKEIAKLNKIRDPKKVKPGQKIKVPAP